MLTETGYYYKDMQNYKDIDSAPVGQIMFVISAGHYKPITIQAYDSPHKKRYDYNIIYVKNGVVYYEENGIEKTAEAGSFLIYKPGEIRNYRYFLKDKTDVYWVHFSGTSATAFLQAQNLLDERKITLKPDKKYELTFKAMISSLNSKDDFTNPLNSVYIQGLILNIAKDRATYYQKEKISQEYQKAIAYINDHLSEKITLNDIADFSNVSTKTITRHFEKNQNMSPIKYVNFLRVEKAKILLQTKSSIGEIAGALGFDDPLYFSTVFRRFTGLSPEKYRKSTKEK